MATTLRDRPAAVRRAAGVAVSALLVTGLAACSWGSQEPGLFTTPQPSVTPVDPDQPAPQDPTRAPAGAGSRLPVLAEALWTTADGNGVTVRFAVHALRREAGVTVLDWSVTPLAGPGRRAGDLVPSGTDLGLSRSVAEQAISLLDVATGQVYRPLADVGRQRFSRCLCTPLFVVTPQLRFGRTTLLQLAFPALAEGASRVDVVLPNVAVVPGVPLSPVGVSPVAPGSAGAEALARPAAAGNPVTGEKTFTAPGGSGRRQTVVVTRVVAGRGLTSVVWTLHSVSDQPGLGAPAGPPLSAPAPDGVRVLTEDPASGPTLRVAGRRDPVGVRWTTSAFAGRPAYECLCSGLGLWSRGLRYDGGSAHVTTHVGPLPAGTRRVDVAFPGLSAFTDVPVTWRPDTTGRRQTEVPSPREAWTYEESGPPSGWTPDQWPTPLPATSQLGEYASRPERLLARLPTS